MKYVYEFIGTFFLIFTIGMTTLAPAGAGLLAPLAIGSVLAVFVYAGGHISGSHYNPAVSLAVFLRGRMVREDLWIYWIVQLAAAILAAYMTIYFKGAPSPVTLDLDIFKAFIAEFLFTFALCYVVLNVATSRATAGNSYYGLAIGFTVLAGAYAVGDVSGGAFNPAVGLGLLIMKVTYWSNIWIYFIANMLGAAAAAYVFKEAHPAEI